MAGEDEEDEREGSPPPQPPTEIHEVTLVQVMPEDSSLRHVKELIFEYTEFLMNKGCDVGTFQDLDRELEELPGRYAKEKGGCLLVAYRAGSPYLEDAVPIATVKLKKAVKGGEEIALGCGGLKDLGDGTCEMKRLFVREGFRGAGLGKIITDAVVKEAEANASYSAVRLDTLRRLEGVSEMYVSMGFTECAPYVPNPMPDAVFMHRPLRPAD